MQKMRAYVRTSAHNQTVELANAPLPKPDDHKVLVQVEAVVRVAEG